MNLRIFVTIVVCCACLYDCDSRGQLVFPWDIDFNADSSFYPKRIGAQWKYAGGERSSSGVPTDPWAPTWSNDISKNWVWELIQYKQINLDSASLLISVIATTTHERYDSYISTSGSNGPQLITRRTVNTSIHRDTGTIGITRHLITMEFKHDFLKPMGAYWDGRNLNSSRYSHGPFAKRRGYVYYVPFYSSRFASGGFQQTEFIP